MNEFLAELKRRHVYRVGVAYTVAGWLLVQIVSTVFPVLELPARGVKIVIVLVLLGLPVALILAWAFDLTPEGIKRAEDVPSRDAAPRRTGRKLIAAIVIAAVAAAALLVAQLTRPLHGRSSASLSIAVLPFESLSDDKANSYFASGIQDEILTNLAKVRALKVISRSSTQQYQSKPGNVRDIGQQLGVANLLQGTVQKAGDMVRINVQLVRAATDENIWAESYNRKLDDILAVEGEVASAIADALNAKLTGAEQKALATRPTNNLAAYDLYLRGLDAEHQSFGPEQLTSASRAFAAAVKLDPQFASAWAHGSIVDSLLYFQAFDHSAERLATTREGADTAMRLAPHSVEAWLALGYYLYRGVGDYAAALNAFEEAGNRAPGNPEVLAARCVVERRRGNYAKANELIRQSLDRDPRNVNSLTTAGDTLLAIRQPAAARRYFERALSIQPGDVAIEGLIAQSYMFEGNLDAAGELLDPLPPQFTSAATFAIQIEYKHLRHDWPWLINTIQAVLNSPAFELNGWVSGLYPELGWAQRWAGDEAGAQETFRDAQSKLEALRKRVGDNGYITGSLSSVEAGLGNCDVALGEAQEAVTAAGDDHYVRALLVGSVAIHQALCGRNDEAIATLDRIAHEPISFVHLGKLRFGIEWDKLRADPRFEKLVSETEAAMNRQPAK